MEHQRSIDFGVHRRSLDVIAQGTLTNSKSIDTLIKGVYPSHFVSGTDCRLTDTMGRTYIDYVCGLGTCLFGYRHEHLLNAAIKEMSKGWSFSMASKTEVEAAEKLLSIFLFDRVKFLKTGSEACSAAIKIARTATQRMKILSSGYHGWHDEFISLAPPAYGVPSRETILPLINIGDINASVAAVIIEPIITDCSDQRISYLNTLREICTRHGVILIFDEIITGLRFKDLSVSRHYNITPDILLLGKALAGGFPLAAVLGNKEIMDNKKYFVSSTFAGENISLAVMSEVLNLLDTRVYKIDALWREGQFFIDNFNAIFKTVSITGYPTRGIFTGDKNKMNLIWQGACDANIFFGPSFFYNFCHHKYSDHVLSLLNDINQKIENNKIKLEGEEPQSPFSSGVRNGKNG